MRKIDVYARFAPFLLLIAMLSAACSSSTPSVNSSNGQNESSGNMVSSTKATGNETNTLPTTTASSAGATAQSVATVTSGTITKNLLLTCGTNCNDPIRVTITDIQVNDADGNMIWNISLKNITGTSVSYGIDKFELLANGAQNQIPATFAQQSGTLPNNDPYSIQGVFAFVPTQNTTYQLTAKLNENGGALGGGVTITFDPAQINF